MHDEAIARGQYTVVGTVSAARRVSNREMASVCPLAATSRGGSALRDPGPRCRQQLPVGQRVIVLRQPRWLSIAPAAAGCKRMLAVRPTVHPSSKKVASACA